MNELEAVDRSYAVAWQLRHGDEAYTLVRVDRHLDSTSRIITLEAGELVTVVDKSETTTRGVVLRVRTADGRLLADVSAGFFRPRYVGTPEPREALTKAQAVVVARGVYGYVSPGEPGRHREDYASCPLCRGRVSLADRPYPRSLQAPSAREIRDAVVRHLTVRYGDERCPVVASVRPGSEWKD